MPPRERLKFSSKLKGIAQDRIILTGEANQASINLTLREDEKVTIGRYVQNELYVEDFLTKVNQADQLKDEVLFFGYFAGHGCGDTKRIFVLNET